MGTSGLLRRLNAVASPQPRINAIATSVPTSECDATYQVWAARQLEGRREAQILERMMKRSGIGRRFTVLSSDEHYQSEGGFYDVPEPPSTLARMEVYAREAPKLAVAAIGLLGDTGNVTHLVVASCTGFTAPGLDQVIARKLGLAPTVERVVIGFMGCYAGVTALRTAGHIVRSDPTARVLVVSVELCTLHLQATDRLDSLLAMSQFADGAAAALVTAEGPGLALGDGLSMTLEDSQDLITWTIGDTGFAMELSGEVPGRLAEALSDGEVRDTITSSQPVSALEAWAIHPGGKSILDAVERGLALPSEKVAASRAVLQDFGNMSSATVLFVLERSMTDRPDSGVALAFGPGLAMEGLRFGWTEGDAD